MELPEQGLPSLASRISLAGISLILGEEGVAAHADYKRLCEQVIGISPSSEALGYDVNGFGWFAWGNLAQAHKLRVLLSIGHWGSHGQVAPRALRGRGSVPTNLGG